MAETEERSLDNFFAKRDKKKKKERSSRAASAASATGAAGGAGGCSGAAGAAGGGAGTGTRPGDGGTSGAATGPGAATKAVTKVRGREGRDVGPGRRAGARVPAPACLPEEAPWRGSASGPRGTEAGHVTWAAHVGRSLAGPVAARVAGLEPRLRLRHA